MVEDPDPSCIFVCRQMCTWWHKVLGPLPRKWRWSLSTAYPSPEHVLALPGSSAFPAGSGSIMCAELVHVTDPTSGPGVHCKKPSLSSNPIRRLCWLWTLGEQLQTLGELFCWICQ